MPAKDESRLIAGDFESSTKTPDQAASLTGRLAYMAEREGLLVAAPLALRAAACGGVPFRCAEWSNPDIVYRGFESSTKTPDQAASLTGRLAYMAEREGLLVAAPLALRAAACGGVPFRCAEWSNPDIVYRGFESLTKTPDQAASLTGRLAYMAEREGFEPSMGFWPILP
jgi:poly(3-hydroxybutyrate) depolymerase